jgi:hypothetical protein
VEDVLACGQAPHGDPTMVAFRRLLGVVAERGPVLALVDDVQYADGSSTLVLAQLAECPDLAVRFVLSAQETGVPGLYGENWRPLRLGPLSPAESTRLLDRLPGAPRGRERVDILQAAAGNPLAIVEFARAAADRAGASFDAQSPGTTRSEGFVTMVERLPAATQRLLLHAALAEPGVRPSVIGAAAGVSDLWWGPAEEAGLVTRCADQVAFTHPLARVTAASAPTAVRQEAHRQLSAVMSPSAPGRLRQLAQASFGADEELAAALERQAEDAHRRGDFLDAARDFETAAERSGDAGQRAHRYARALLSTDRYGDLDWTRQLQREYRRHAEAGECDVHAAIAFARQLSGEGRQRLAMNTLVAVLHQAEQGGPEHAALTSTAAQIAAESGLGDHSRRVMTALRLRPATPAENPSRETAGPSGDWCAPAHEFTDALTTEKASSRPRCRRFANRHRPTELG